MAESWLSNGAIEDKGKPNWLSWFITNVSVTYYFENCLHLLISVDSRNNSILNHKTPLQALNSYVYLTISSLMTLVSLPFVCLASFKYLFFRYNAQRGKTWDNTDIKPKAFVCLFISSIFTYNIIFTQCLVNMIKFYPEDWRECYFARLSLYRLSDLC